MRVFTWQIFLKHESNDKTPYTNSDDGHWAGAGAANAEKKERETIEDDEEEQKKKWFGIV